MRELQPVISDDLDWAEKDKTRTPATQTRYFGYEGRWYQLDLTDEHAAELDRIAKRYSTAGQKPELPPRPSSQGRGAWASAVARNKAMREWAAANGLPFTHKEGGGYNYPLATVRAWEEHERMLEGISGVGSDPTG